MLYHNNRITQVAQLLQHLDEAFRVTAMQANTRFVQDVKAAHKTASQRGSEVDALALAARKAIGSTVESKVTQTDIQQVLQSIPYFCENAFSNLFLVFIEVETFHPRQQFADRYVNQFSNALPSHLHVVRFGPESCAMTFGTDCLSTISGQHDAVLYLILSLPEEVEEGINRHQSPLTFLGIYLPIGWDEHFLATQGFLLQLSYAIGRGWEHARNAVPEPVFLLLCQFEVWFEDGKTALGVKADEPCFPLAHLFASPTHHCSVVEAQGGVGYYHLFVYADNLTEAFTFGTGSDGGIKGKEFVGRLLEGYAVCLKACTELVSFAT